MTGIGSYLLGQADAVRIPLGDRSVDFVMGSPPYRLARLYLENGRNLGIARDTEDWITWMLAVTTEALRVSRGAVVWIAAGSTQDRNYQPICEGLTYRWWAMGGHAYRPCYWHRVGIPGSGGDQWFRADIEYAMCFKRAGALPWTDNTAMGHVPKYGPGGEMSYRETDGTRRNAHGVRTDVAIGSRKTGRKSASENYRARATLKPHVELAHRREFHRTDGTVEVQAYVQPVKANPGNLIHTKVGGGHLGHTLAHENEAPYPERLVEWFVRSLCPPGGTTLDVFSGSGTTASVAARNGRHGIGLDLRRSQCDLGARRVGEQVADEIRPHRQKVNESPVKPLEGQQSLFD